MDHFSYRAGHLYCEDVEANQLAQEFGTPLFVYSKKTLTEHLTRFRNAFASLNPLICFSVKSCNNLAVLRCLAEAGAGMDVVSGGEIYRAKLAGVDMRKVVYAGSAKTDREIEEALLAEIGWLNIESTGELEAVIRLSSENASSLSGGASWSTRTFLIRQRIQRPQPGTRVAVRG